MFNRITLLLFFCAFSLSVFSQKQSSTFLTDYETFLNNQKTKFTQANRECFNIDGIVWHRSFGEFKYVLMPLVQNIREYNKLIGNSQFHFVTVEITELSKTLLSSMFIFVPDYIQDTVLVFIPDINIDQLLVNNIGLRYNDTYGKLQYPNTEAQSLSAIIWSSGFEIPSFSSTFVGGWSGVDCNWDLATCNSHGGSRSAWCASVGTDCNQCGALAASNIDSDFEKYIPINMSSYKNSLFKFWKWQDLDISEMNDRLEHWINTGSGWTLSSTFKSDAAFNGGGWWIESTLLSGAFPSFNFRFLFVSDGYIDSPGVYLDDLELSGAVNGVEENNGGNKIIVNPNPSQGLFSVTQFDISQELQLSIINILGDKIFETTTSSTETIIDISNQPPGLYFFQVNSKEGTATKKLIIE